MVSFYGDYNLTETVNIPFNTFSSDDPSASVTVTNLANGDIYVHKDGVEGTPTGITVSLNVGAVNGNHLAILDLSDVNDAGFYAVGARYQVRMEGVTIDGATVNAWIGAFSIGCTLRPTTAGRTVDVESTGEVGLDFNNIKDATGAHTLTNITVPTATTVTNRVTADMTYIHGSALTESPGMLAARFSDFFDQAAAAFSINTPLASFMATGFATAAVCTEARLARLDAAVSSRNAVTPPTVGQMNARTLATADYATAVNQATIAGYIDTEITAITAAIAALNDLSAAQVNAQVLDVLNVDTLIDGKTFVESQQIIAAAAIGVCAGAGTGTETFDGLDGVTLRATVTVDADGNRSVVVYP